MLRFLHGRAPAALLGALALLAGAGAAAAVPGALDTRFSSDGRVTTEFDGALDIARAVAVQPNGRIVVVGSSDSVEPFVASNFALARYLKDGAPDPSFGTEGRVITDFGPHSQANAVALQRDGKILVAGWIQAETATDFVVARYLTSGTLDSSFGTGGRVITDIGASSEDAVHSVLIQKDGKIVAAGYAARDFNFNFAVARYTKEGALDPSFNGGGTVESDLEGTDLITAASLQPDGKIVVAGVTNSQGENDFAVGRYTSSGKPDVSFGVAGAVRTDAGGKEAASAVQLQKDGKIVVVGTTEGVGFRDVLVARYLKNGTLDRGFDEDGVNGLDSGDDDRGAGVAIQKDGKIVVVGSTQAGGNPTPLFLVARLKKNGSLDTKFGPNGAGGAITTSFSGNDRASAVAIQKDGKIVVVGDTFSAGNHDFAVARYQK